MKQRLSKLLVAALLALLSSAGAARAQTQSQMFTHVPFDFYVREQRFPAGDYYVRSVSPQAGPAVMQLRSRDGKVSRIFIATYSELPRAGKAGEPALLFNRYGESHFLAVIQDPSQGFYARLSKVKCERDLAGLSDAPETVTVKTPPDRERVHATSGSDGARPGGGRFSNLHERTAPGHE